jgi:hypothetical protein
LFCSESITDGFREYKPTLVILNTNPERKAKGKWRNPYRTDNACCVTAESFEAERDSSSLRSSE